MRLLNKKIILVLAVAILSFTLMGCSNSSSSVLPANVDEGISVVEITGICTAELAGDKVKVSVVTDMRSDIVFKLSVTDEAGNVLDEIQMTKVSDVDPTAEFTIQPEWPDVVYGFLVADPDDNDVSSITSSYGKKFGNITYDGMVYNSGKNYIVFISEPLTIR